jgi:nitrate reductase assembly molybdenum cofactor insertion protein NarJ
MSVEHRTESAAPTSAEELLRLAGRWRLLGRCFERPRSGWLDDIRALAAEIDDPLLRATAQRAETAGEPEYLAVFGPGGTVSPREAAYRPMQDPGRILAEVTGLYRAFAFRPDVEDPPDHVAVETACVAYLMLKEAYARFGNRAEEARRTEAARRAFVEEHLSEFASELSQRLELAGSPLLAQAGSVLAAWCPGSSAEPARLRVVGDDPLGPNGDCGACGGS